MPEDLVRRDARPDASAAHHDAALRLATQQHVTELPRDVREVALLAAEDADVAYLVSAPLQLLDQRSFEREASVVAAND